MTSYAIKKRNKTKRNIKQVARIKYELGVRGLKMVDIAKDLNITQQAVQRAVYGLSTVTRVDEWLDENIGLVV